MYLALKLQYLKIFILSIGRFWYSNKFSVNELILATELNSFSVLVFGNPFGNIIIEILNI